MKKIILSAMLAGSALLADNVVNSTDGLGDFLIAPLYLAKGNICTKVTVYNTNQKKSILAKVAFREQLHSNEVDLPIFLSPGDTWSATVCQENGHTVLTSKDDSNHPAIKAELALGKDLTAQSYAAGNKNVDFSAGYIEVYPIAEFNDNKKIVSKSVLVKRWDSLIKGKMPAKLRENGVDGYSLSGNVVYETNDKYTVSLPMKAFKGAHDKVLTGSAIAYGNDTSPDVLLGTTKKQQLLKLMQHSTTAFTFTNYGKDQYIVFTFPFGYSKNQIRKFKFTIRDMDANLDEKKKEVVIFSPAPKKVEKPNFMRNEVAIIPVSELIAKTKNPSKFEDGQIQITNVTNVTNVQLGTGENASFFATLITIKSDKNKKEILNASYTPLK